MDEKCNKKHVTFYKHKFYVIATMTSSSWHGNTVEKKSDRILLWIKSKKKNNTCVGNNLNITLKCKHNT